MKIKSIAAAFILAAIASQGQASQIDMWTYDGGGLDPVTYSGNYLPTELIPDGSYNNGATIGVNSDSASGGLGSTSFGTYGMYYTLFSYTTFTLNTTNVLSGVETISVSFLSSDDWGQGFDSDYIYKLSSLTLNFNSSNTAVAADSFNSVLLGDDYPTPFGPMSVSVYTWTWDVSGLGISSEFEVSWEAGNHTPYIELALVQAIPEPSSLLLLGFGLLTTFMYRRRRKN